MGGSGHGGSHGNRNCGRSGWEFNDGRVLGNIGGANASEVTERRLQFLIRGAPGVDAGLDLVCELGGWAEACSVAVGLTLGDGEPCVHALRDHLGTGSRYDR